MNKDKAIKDLKKRNDSLKMQYEYRNIRCITLENRIEKYEQQIDQLTNNWNELEEWLEYEERHTMQQNNYHSVLDKMKKIKEKNNGNQKRI